MSDRRSARTLRSKKSKRCASPSLEERSDAVQEGHRKRVAKMACYIGCSISVPDTCKLAAWEVFLKPLGRPFFQNEVVSISVHTKTRVQFLHEVIQWKICAGILSEEQAAPMKNEIDILLENGNFTGCVYWDKSLTMQMDRAGIRCLERVGRYQPTILADRWMVDITTMYKRSALQTDETSGKKFYEGTPVVGKGLLVVDPALLLGANGAAKEAAAKSAASDEAAAESAAADEAAAEMPAESAAADEAAAEMPAESAAADEAAAESAAADEAAAEMPAKSAAADEADKRTKADALLRRLQAAEAAPRATMHAGSSSLSLIPDI